MEEKRAVATVAVVIKNDTGKVLLGKRPDKMDSHSTMEEQGTWTLPMTELKHNEELEQAAARVVIEETGLKIDFSRVACVNNDKIDAGHLVTVGMVSDRWSGAPEVKNPSKIAEWGWFDLEDSPFPIFIPSAKVLLCLRKGKFNFSN